MYRSILVPLDGSPLGEQAVPAAVALCRLTAARLHLVHVRTVDWLLGRGEDMPDERSYLEAVCGGVSNDLGESVSFALLPHDEPRRLGPNPAPAEVAARLTDYARTNGIGLIVMATHGRGGFSRLYFGSVVEALLATVETPLLLIRPTEEADPDRWKGTHPLRRILVPVAGAMAEAIIDAAHDLGSSTGASFTLLRVVALPTPAYEPLAPVASIASPQDLDAARRAAEEELQRLAEPLRKAGHQTTIDIAVGHSPANAILECARSGQYDAITLGTHARRGIDRMLLGSVANKVLRAADCPTLVVPPAATAEEREPRADQSSTPESR